MAPEQVALVGEYADVLQVGTRKMQNIPLLHPVGVSGKPVLLRRGTMSTLEELLLLAAKHIMTRGNRRVIFCDVGSGLRDLHEKHARYQYSASTFRTDPPASVGRPVSYHRATQPGPAGLVSRRGRRCSWSDSRSAPRSRGGVVRRTKVFDVRGLRRAHEVLVAGRRGDRPLHWQRR